MNPSLQLSFDAAHPRVLLEFWCAVLGYELEPEVPEVAGAYAAAVDPTGRGPRLIAQTVPEGKTAKNRLHLDVHLDEGVAREAEVARLVTLGAVHHDTRSEFGLTWAVCTDPEGNEFCVA